MKSSLRVGMLVVESGEKQYGPLKIAARADGSDIFIPLMIINGREDGPILNISGGCHGDEFEGMEAVRRIYRAIDPNELKGAIIGSPVVNTPALEVGQRCSYVDQYNLNRCFPGKENGFLTERFAYVYFNEVIRKADYVMDFHGGGNIMCLAPIAIYRDIGGENVAKKAEELVKATGIDLVWKGSGGWIGPISLEAQKIGIPAITVEVAGEARVRESVIQQFETMIYNVLSYFRMIQGEPDLPKKVQFFEGTFINCTNGGFYQQSVDLKEMVKKGDLLATICNVYGEVVEKIRAPFEGIVCSKRTFGTIEPGGWTLMIGKLL